mmetsp:Transcript_85628/g.228325  ORF Transcript_85628/g.228325 Transcript_85628/m.228325 type:complete len:236 (+) Transcript_85628:335-1042(+)
MTATNGDTVGNFKTLSIGSVLVGSMAVYCLIFAVSLLLLFPLFCYKNQYPLNYWLLTFWTVSIAFSVATACARTVCDPMVTIANGDGTVNNLPLSLVAGVDAGSLKLFENGILCAVGTESAQSGVNAVMIAVCITSAIFVSLTLFTFQSKWDFSFLGAGLFAALSALMFWGFLMFIFGSNSFVRYLYSLAGTLIFSLYIVYDTWKVCKVYTPDDYIEAAIDLYLVHLDASSLADT